MLQIGNVIVSFDVFTECFCCDLDACGGACCVEGESGAPLRQEEILHLEDALDGVWPLLSARAQSEIDQHGVATVDPEGDLVTSIVGGKDCVFTCYDAAGCCCCAVEKILGSAAWSKPISCALYPIREKQLGDGLVGLNVHRWSVCDAARRKGRELGLPVYKFLRAPLVRRFGQEWYDELCTAAHELRAQGML
ncbi:MAG: DUF3109 family protein [Bacteroidaceae bacterium]|nr:DUF3109 family protein [Bacteroidaceae bacterium]